jgi:hypothetical protein
LAWLLLPAAGWLACSGDLGSPSAPGTTEVSVLIGAADIGVCGSSGTIATGALLAGQAGTVFAAGDLAYPDGTTEQFRDCYDPSWGHQKHRTRPAPGNHEYGSPNAAPYFAYFGANAGPLGLGYYRYTSGVWQVYSLNSNMESPHLSSQRQWLKRELAGQPALCSVAYFHHPLVSSGSHGLGLTPPVVRDLWTELYSAGVDVVIVGHEHFYERFASLNPDGRADPDYGIRQFIVGTGGAPLRQPVQRVPNSEALLVTFGILRLTLDLQSYQWEFISAGGGGVLDSGIGRCHPRRP